MERRTRRLLFTIAILLVPLLFVYVHDNPAGLVHISAINSGRVPIGANVTVKGEIVDILMLFMGTNDQYVKLSDGTGNLTFYWTRTRLDIGWVIIMSGTVYRTHNLRWVTSVERVALFA